MSESKREGTRECTHTHVWGRSKRDEVEKEKGKKTENRIKLNINQGEK